MCAFNLLKGEFKMKDLGIYIHIPFCVSKCYYCDFISFPNLSRETNKYVDYLIKEMKMYKELLKDYRVSTVFIGGGTPSYLEPIYIYKILDSIYKNFSGEFEEITIEANPGTLDSEKLRVYKESRINRISLGVQSLDDRLLKTIGRAHSSKDFYKSIEKIRNTGFKNINTDLIFGLPSQSLKDCEKSLREILRLNIEHISYYSLILEENTLMDKWYKEGKIILPDEDLEREMYYLGKDILKANGYKHYEISNFAKENYESQHNLKYWELKPYIGFGISSHSNLDNKRFWNYSDLNNYYNNINKGRFPISGEEYIDKEMEMAEYLIMGLRLIDGIDKNNFFDRFNIKIENMYGNVLNKHKKNGLLYIDENSIRFTAKGLDLSNKVYVDILP